MAPGRLPGRNFTPSAVPDKPLAAKLGLRAGQTVLALNPARAVLRQLKRTSRGVRWLARWPKSRVDMILVWFRARDDVRSHFKRYFRRITPEGAVWAAVAKATVKDADSPPCNQMVKAALASGVWVDNKICSVSARDYATRFVVRKEQRKSIGG